MIPRSRLFSLIMAAMLSVAGAARAVPLNISEAGDFNLLTWGNATLINSDTEGRVAVGGNATFGSYSIGTHASNASPADASFIVGGNLTAGHGQVSNGSIYVGGTYSGPSYKLNSKAGSVTQWGLGSAVPFDFSAAKTALTAKSAAFAAEAVTGTSLLKWSTLTLTGTETDTNIFNITAAQLASASSLVINATAGSRVLINVSGTSSTFSNKGISGTFDAHNVLFNFYEATSLSMSGIGVQGSILAPLANVSFYSGQMNGQLIANSFSGASWGVGELHNYSFNNEPLPPPPAISNVPDGSGTVSLVLGAFLGLALIHRRIARGAV